MWFVLTGLVVLRLFFWWEQRLVDRGGEPLVDTRMLRNARLAGGLILFFFQFLIQAGLFFVVPLFLSVALGLSAVETGVRLLPLSVTLLAAAVGIPKLWPQASPRKVVARGLAALFAGHRGAGRRARGRRRRRGGHRAAAAGRARAWAHWRPSSAR